MPDMLAKPYDLPIAGPYEASAQAAGVSVRRAEAWDRFLLRRFITQHFNEGWAAEADFMFSTGHPITGFVAVKDGLVVGFAAYESSRRGFFGPTGVREDLRGCGAGALLLLRSLESMRDMGYGYAIIGWVGPAEFYTRIVGATVIEASDRGVYGAYHEELAAGVASLKEPNA